MNVRKPTPKTKTTVRPPVKSPVKREETTDMILNRLISGNGVKRRRMI